MEDITVRGKRIKCNMLLLTFNELIGKISLENVAKDFKFTNACMLVNRQNKANGTENNKTAQKENMKRVLEGVEEDCVAYLKTLQSWAGAGAVLYLND